MQRNPARPIAYFVAMGAPLFTKPSVIVVLFLQKPYPTEELKDCNNRDTGDKPIKGAPAGYRIPGKGDMVAGGDEIRCKYKHQDAIKYHLPFTGILRAANIIHHSLDHRIIISLARLRK